MRRIVLLLAALLVAGPAPAQFARNVTAETVNVDGSSFAYSALPAPTPCVSTSVPFFGVDLKLTCDGGLTYDAATDTLTTVDLRFSGTASVGFVPKTLTTAQRDALSTPPAGSMIYNSTTGRVEVYDGAAWHGRVRLTGDTMTGDLIVTKGAGTATGRVSNVLNVNTTSQATTGTSEQVLATYTLPANTLARDGQAVRVRAWGTHAANTNGTTGRIRFGGIGGTAVATHFSSTSNGSWILEAVIVRTGAATQAANGNGNYGTNSPSVSNPTQTLANAIDIVVTGTTAVSAGDLTYHGMIVEALN